MNRAGRHIAMLAALMLAPLAEAAPKEPHVYGPEPEWEKYRQIAEADIRSRLIDPDSAKIEWSGLYHKGGFKPFLQSRVEGYVGCGNVNARNRMGGFAGATSFVVVFDYDRVLFAEIDRRAGGMIAEQCSSAHRAGLLKPLPPVAAAAASGTDSAVANTAGLSLRAMPDGAYITAVEPGSAAATAGLAPGMVIASINAIPLTGMGDAMLKVVDAAGSRAALTLVGGKAVTLGGRP